MQHFLLSCRLDGIIKALAIFEAYRAPRVVIHLAPECAVGECIKHTVCERLRRRSGRQDSITNAVIMAAAISAAAVNVISISTIS